MLGIEFKSFVAAPLQMSDGPEIVHVVSGRAHLAMRAVLGDRQQVSALNLEDLVSQLAMSVPVGRAKSIIIDLRLGVGVGRIGAPSPRKINHFTQHQLAFRRPVAVVEDQPDDTVTGILEDALAPCSI